MRKFFVFVFMIIVCSATMHAQQLNNIRTKTKKMIDKYVDHFPYNIESDNLEPIYKELKGWNKDISDCKVFEELPKEAKDYIAFIQLETNCPITRVSVGPDRLQTIMR